MLFSNEKGEWYGNEKNIGFLKEEYVILQLFVYRDVFIGSCNSF